MRRAAGVLALLLLLPAPARATSSDEPVQFRVLAPLVRTPGHVRGTIEARALLPGAFALRSLQVDRGRVRSSAFPAPVALAANATTTIPFEADVDDSAAVFELDYTLAGDLHGWRFDLRPFGRDGQVRIATAVQLARGAGAAPRALTEADRALPVRTEAPARVAAPAGATGTPGERDITIRGRIVYQRPAITPRDDAPVFPATTLGVEGVTVSIYDNDGIFLTYLSKTETNADGTFSQTFHWQPLNLFDQNPDITLSVSCSNDHFRVMNPVGLQTYSFSTGTWNNIGSDLDVGTWTSQESDQGALDVLNNLMKGRNWYRTHEGFDTPYVNVFWPEPDWPGGIGGSGSWYSSVENGIHLASDRTWDAPSHLHEYGHFFIHNYGASQTPDYCNGFCDGSGGPVPTPWTCGHCAWCRETDHDAWNEGWADWIGEVQTVDCGLAHKLYYSAEEDYLCDDDHQVHDPLRTEGYLQALLRDVWDPKRTDDPGIGLATWGDVMQLGTHEIFQVTTQDKPTTTQGFIDAFNNRFPQYQHDFYAVRRHNGFPSVDHTPPSAITGLASSTHPNSVWTTSHTVHLSWNPSTDDYSGVAYYIVGAIHRSVPNWPQPDLMPFHWQVAPDTTWGDFTISDWGDFVIEVEAVDRDGNRTSAAWLAPILINPPTAFDLLPYKPAGWADSTVARSLANSSGTSVPAQTTQLPGNSAGTYWNTSILNPGPASTSIPVVPVGLYVDGKAAASSSFNSTLTPNHYFTVTNVGPLTIAGGRHSFVSVADPADTLGEFDETNNAVGRQYVWSPATLLSNTNYTFPAPGHAMGWDGVHGDMWFNAYGLRMTPPATSWWNLVVTVANDANVDYDCRLHWTSASPDTGFGANIGWSGRPAGCLDGVLVNRNTMPQATWDVGVINDTGAPASFSAMQITSTPWVFGDSLLLNLPQTTPAMVRELYVSAANAGPVSVVLRQARGTGPLHVAYFDRTFTTGALLDANDVAVTDTSTGITRLYMNATTAGYYGIVVWRDPVDFTAPTSFVMQVMRTPPDLQPWTPSGWHSSFVPRARKDGTTASVALPDTLYGDTTSTYLNFGLANMSPTGGTGFQCEYDLDGVGTWWLGVGSFTGWAFAGVNDGTAYSIAAGRHTLTAKYDVPDQVKEIFEDNNTFGEQYVWGARNAPLETLFLRGAPSDRTGGWTSVSDSVRYFNCDGWRMPKTNPVGNDGYWEAAVILPIGDADLRLHEALPGSKSGFGPNLALSGWGPQQTDFAIVNFNKTAVRAFDAGVLGSPAGSPYYFGAVVRSRWLGTQPVGTFGPFTFDGYTLLKLHEVYLAAGTYTVDLLVDTGTSDWGLSVYGPAKGVYVKSDAIAASWAAGAGGSETVSFTVSTAGYYAVAAWLANGSGSGTGTYRLRFRSGTADVDGGAPHAAATRLAPPEPNPSRGATQVAFTLAGAADVTLAVYDVRGGRVHTLLAGRREAGEYRLAWDGRDDRGRPSAPGVYLVRLDGAGPAQVRKLVRIE